MTTLPHPPNIAGRHRRVLLVAIAGCAVLFVLLAWAVCLLVAPWTTWLDTAATTGLAPLRANWLLRGFVALTGLGTEAALLAVVLAATALLWADTRRRQLIPPLWLVFVGTYGCVWVAKYLFGRARPTFLEGVATAASPSFPSGHSAGSIAVMGFVAFAAAHGLPAAQRRLALPMGVGLALLVALSRVFLGVHFLTDVLAGLALGTAWLLVGILLRTARAAPDGSGPG